MILRRLECPFVVQTLKRGGIVDLDKTIVRHITFPKLRSDYPQVYERIGH